MNNKGPQNNGLHQTKGARSGRFAAGRLEAPFAGEAGCSTGCQAFETGAVC